MNRKSSGNWTLFLYLLCGIVLGSFLGEYLGGLPYMGWLRFGESFGMTSPLVLNLSVIRLEFAARFTVNIAGIIGLFLGVLAYKKL